MNRKIVVHEVGDDGLVSLPVAESLLDGSVARVNAIVGWMSRGAGGTRFEANRIEHGCPMVLWVVPGIPILHWVARIEPASSTRSSFSVSQTVGTIPSGSLRLVSNPSQPGSMQCGLASTNSMHADLSSLGLPDKHGGWTVGGHLGLHVPVEGLLGVRIQAIAQNCRVLWSAISQAHPE